MDWLSIWGVAYAMGFAFKPIMQDLATEATKDYAKDFFKNCLGKVVRLPEKNIQKEAYGKALKALLELVQQQLELAGLSEEAIKEYNKPLRAFVHHPSVETILGSAFVVDCQTLDTSTLAKTWQDLNLPNLPTQFNWEMLGKFYIRNVREIIQNSDKLRPIFSIQLQEITSESLQEIAGVAADFDLQCYVQGLQNEYDSLQLESLDATTYEKIKLWQIFVPQTVRECQQFIPQLEEMPKERRKELWKRGEIELAEQIEEGLERRRREYFNQSLSPILEVIRSKENKLVILGDPGAGKSTLLKYLALNWAESPLSEISLHPLPLLVELRTYARDKEQRQCHNFLEFFHRGNLFCHLNQHTLHQKLQDGQAIALFDGLDEVFDSNLRHEIINDIHRFSIDYPNVRIIATSRWLGYKAEKLSNAGFKHFMLQDLDDRQIQDFIQRWHDLAYTEGKDKTRKKERLQKAINESPAIKQLAGNPLLLTMMAILNRHQELPRDRPKLYERASEVLLHQWDFETKDQLQDPELKKYLRKIEIRDKKDMLRAVANAMQSGEKGLAANLIYREDLEIILANYLESTGIEDKRETRDIAELVIEQLRKRNFILCSLGGNSFAFVHRTFLEYFCACEFYERFKKRGLEGGMTLEELKTEVFGQHWQDSSWHEVLRLIVGMLSAEFPKEITEELINYLIDQDGAERDFINIFLAADCFSELRNRSAYTEIGQKLLDFLRNFSGFNQSDRVSASPTSREMKEKAVSIIAKTWQDEPVGWTTLQSMTWPSVVWYVEKEAIQSLSTIAKTHPEALPHLKELAQKSKSEAIEALSQHWRDDSETLPIIKQQAQNGKREAIEALVQHWRDDSETLPIIKQQAQKGKREAIEALVQHWRDDSETLPIIKQQSQKSESEAIKALVQHWRDDSETLPIIKQQSQKSESEAIEALVQHWRDDSETLPIIKQQAQKSESEAIEALVQHWRDDSETLPIIKQQAQKGKSEAIEALVQHWRDDSETLPIIKRLVQNSERGAIAVLIALTQVGIDPELKTMLEEILVESKIRLELREEYEKLLNRGRFKPSRKQEQGGHFSTLRTKMTDPEILISSLRDLGLTVRTDADVRGSNGQRVRADVVAILEGDYDIGWSKNSDGSFDLITDLWGVAKKHNQTELLNSISQKYAVKKNLKEVKERGLNR
jgi:GTPase SAR1 family protein/Na+-translocating ferredoxin:NAD+ oxidoreductase RnfG subunit